MKSYPPEKIDIFCHAFQIPEFVKPWLDRFFETQEFELVFETAEKGMVPVLDSKFLERCYRRGIVSFDEDGQTILADFSSRFEIWALFEGWLDVPLDIQTQLNRWQMNLYHSKHFSVIEASQKTGVRDQSHVWPEYALLDEALAIIEQVPHVYQWPCNCRAMMKGCQKPEYVCLRFNNDRNLGWEISKERARELLRMAHKKGLMQSAELGIMSDGSIEGAICNCCSDCCYPQQLADKFDVKTIWPLNRYVVDYNVDLCTTCGRCTKRCPYQAFTMLKEKSSQDHKPLKQIHFDADLCRGCGLCESTCPDKAITMKSLSLSPLSLIPEISK